MNKNKSLKLPAFRNAILRSRAIGMLNSYTLLGKRETEWEKEYYEGIKTLVEDIKSLTE